LGLAPFFRVLIPASQNKVCVAKQGSQGAIMKIAFRILLCLLAFTSRVALAQTRLPISQALDTWIANAEKDVASAADAMPEDKYSFAPTQSQFVGVRTFGQQVKHLAANNYRMAARILGQTPTPDQEFETGPETVQSKEPIMGYVKGSFTALHQAVATINADNALTPVMPTRGGNRQAEYPCRVAVDAVAHSYDHYGQMVEYWRMNGIIPLLAGSEDYLWPIVATQPRCVGWQTLHNGRRPPPALEGYGAFHVIK
jgi:DinB family protein